MRGSLEARVDSLSGKVDDLLTGMRRLLPSVLGQRSPTEVESRAPRPTQFCHNECVGDEWLGEEGDGVDKESFGKEVGTNTYTDGGRANIATTNRPRGTKFRSQS